MSCVVADACAIRMPAKTPPLNMQRHAGRPGHIEQNKTLLVDRFEHIVTNLERYARLQEIDGHQQPRPRAPHNEGPLHPLHHTRLDSHLIVNLYQLPD